MRQILSVASAKARGQLVLGTLCALCTAIASVSIAYLLGRVLDDQAQWALFIAFFLVANVLRIVFSYLQQILFTKFAAGIQSSLREQVGQTLAHMCMSRVDQLRTGDMLTRVNNDMVMVCGFLQNTLAQIVQGVAAVALGLLLLLTIRWEIALFILAGTVLCSFISSRLGVPLGKTQKNLLKTQSELGIQGSDIAFGQMDIKAMDMEAPILARYKAAVIHWVKIFGKRNNVRAWQRGATTIDSVLIFICIPLFSAYFIANGQMQIGTVLAAIQAANIVSGPIMRMGRWFVGYKDTCVSLERIQEMTEETCERQDGNAFPMAQNTPLVELIDVHFAYGEQPILRGISLQLRAGEHIALVGASGSGKSTALRLIAGLYDANSGEVRFGGCDVAQWRLDNMRHYMAYVQQDTYLFPVSLRENIACGETISDMEGIIERAQLREWLSRQPEGLSMEVGERGGKLSGGLKQRASIARAMAKQPLLYLFDEPTSALDVAMEAEIVRAIGRAVEGASSIMVAHRLSSIVDADRIYAMRDGVVVECGTHEELMTLRGYYYDLYTQQREEARDIG